MAGPHQLQPPTKATIEETASRFDIDLSGAELEAFQSLAREALGAYERRVGT